MDVPERCGHCGYDLHGTPWTAAGRLCPECGKTTFLGEAPKSWPVRRPFVFDALLLPIGPVISVVTIAVARYGVHMSDIVLAWLGCTFAVLLALCILWGSRRGMTLALLIWHGTVATVGVFALYWAVGMAIIICLIRC
ncbi:MAG TPA: hypothetical protein VHC70_13260 [Phycisphaerales bacterium]|nr:hypothetical protein [Phycisphaerales bacterium]